MPSELGNIGAAIAELAKRGPDKPCVEQGGRCHTRAEVIQTAQGFAGFLAAEGVGSGDAVAIVAVDPLKGFQAAIALWSIGAVVLFLDPRQTLEELRMAQETSQTSAIFTDSKSFARRGGFGLLPANVPASLPSEGTGISLRFPAGSGDRDAMILASSGTTGAPRFHRVSHRRFLAGMFASMDLLGTPVPRPAVIVGSLAFGAVLSQWIRLMVHGTFILSLPLVFRTKELHQALARADIQSVGLPPVIIRDLLQFHADDSPAKIRPIYPHIKHLTSLGGPIAPDTLVQAFEVLTPEIKNVYSLAGVGAVSLLSGKEILEKPNSVGKPLAGVTIRIETPEGRLCPAGQIGRIVATPDWRDGAVPTDTGDLGWMDDAGYLFVQGRSQQSASRKSINISLADIEQDLKRIKGVRDCIAFALPAENAPDDLVFVAVEGEAELPQIKAQIKGALASYRRPDKILLRGQLPRNAANKISLRHLMDMAVEKDTGFVDY